MKILGSSVTDVLTANRLIPSIVPLKTPIFANGAKRLGEQDSQRVVIGDVSLGEGSSCNNMDFGVNRTDSGWATRARTPQFVDCSHYLLGL